MTRCGKYLGVVYGILSVSQDIVMDLNNVTKLQMSLILGKTIVWPRFQNKYVKFVKFMNVQSFSATTRSTWNMTSLLFRRGEEVVGLAMQFLNFFCGILVIRNDTFDFIVDDIYGHPELKEILQNDILHPT